MNSMPVPVVFKCLYKAIVSPAGKGGGVIIISEKRNHVKAFLIQLIGVKSDINLHQDPAQNKKRSLDLGSFSSVDIIFRLPSTVYDSPSQRNSISLLLIV
jgi:hypothetical protein